jgi:hypothetical protein
MARGQTVRSFPKANPTMTGESRYPPPEPRSYRSLKQKAVFFVKQILISSAAAFMVPGALFFFPVNPLKNASKDNPYEALALVSLCLIAATIGKPFIDFIHEEAKWLMEKRRRTRSREERKRSELD